MSTFNVFYLGHTHLGHTKPLGPNGIKKTLLHFTYSVMAHNQSNMLRMMRFEPCKQLFDFRLHPISSR